MYPFYFRLQIVADGVVLVESCVGHDDALVLEVIKGDKRFRCQRVRASHCCYEAVRNQGNGLNEVVWLGGHERKHHVYFVGAKVVEEF